MNHHLRLFPLNSAILGIVYVLGVSHSSTALAVTIRPGDILVADPDFVHLSMGNDLDSENYQPTLWKIDPRTGEREVVTSKLVGDGVPLRTVSSVVADRQGRITIGDAYSFALVRVDPATGDRSNLTFGGDDNGHLMHAVSALAVDRDDSLIVLDHLSQNVLRVDPVTGYRTLISGPARGAGPSLRGSSLVVDRSGDIWVGLYGDNPQSALAKIDPATGDRQLVSGFGAGSGPELSTDIHDIFKLDDDSILATMQGQLIHIDVTNGHRSVIDISGPQIDMLYSLSRGVDGFLYLGDEYQGAAFQLDLNSGNYSLLSGNSPEWGPRMWMPQDMFVVVPEPSVALLFVMAIAVAGSVRNRKS